MKIYDTVSQWNFLFNTKNEIMNILGKLVELEKYTEEKT